MTSTQQGKGNGSALVKAAPSYIDAAKAHFGEERFALLRDTIGRDLSAPELAMFLEVAMGKKLDPFARQIHAVKRKQRRKLPNGQWVDDWVMTIQTGIDGFRVIAQRTGRYAGQRGPFWCGDDGVWTDVWLRKQPPRAAKVEVLRKDFAEPLVGVALWDEYAQTFEKDGERRLMGLWATHPSVMIAKCYDEETEVLTDRGFERFADARGQVLQVTDRGLEATGARPFAQQYGGAMVALDSDDLNFCVTPNHDMMTTAGKIEAGAMFDAARARAQHWIPRLVRGTQNDAPVSDDDLRLAAIFIADGWTSSGTSWTVCVSREHKVDAIEAIGGWTSRGVSRCAGNEATAASGRTIRTRKDKQRFLFPLARIAALVEDDKTPRMDGVLSLSRRQARILVDTLISFDGSTNDNGVRRFYSSDAEIMAAFELACVIAGYSVSDRKERSSDASDRPNLCVTVSDRDEMPVRRWGRDYHGIDHGAQQMRTGLELQPSTGRVWCVTVPSGVIVVRRRGFSMLCGNCAEAVSLRRAFPEDLAGLYASEEMKAEDVAAEVRARFAELEERVGRTPPASAPPPVVEAELMPASEGMAAEVANLERAADKTSVLEHGELEPPTAEEEEGQTRQSAPPGQPPTTPSTSETIAPTGKGRSLTAKLLEFKRALDQCKAPANVDATLESWAGTIGKWTDRGAQMALGYARFVRRRLETGEEIEDPDAARLCELARG